MRPVALSLILALLAGCTAGPLIDTRYNARSQDSRVQYVVLHYTSEDLQGSLRQLTQGSVSSHYLIDAKPATIYRLVGEERRAWHAGDSQWHGRTWLNASSIGIELVNPGYLDTPNGRLWYPYPPEQIDALIVLLKEIVKRHGLGPQAIIGHSDIAPQRKVDPGPQFPWKRLAEAGLVVWPDARRVAELQARYAARLPGVAWFQEQLVRNGYALERHGVLDDKTRRVIAAFQMKYRPARFDGEPDAETAALLATLNGTG
ncbi:N-acetylmuramoyl-L-alanine amidase [Azotobacter beijerinckii]|uniref:N-acetylmuramoyl-L-alanine amidase n=1 Tax=Azotobacter beijerinckii TaxID=170623 RepID=A0A1I4CVY3_9GAMM|nr:N-acetylmuramoyl-L-alanine amidase [Azotobacter beijerinckii]SFB49390.1 N-acetylmuramoyl-L-alanine amidase [Azotobacter beijerinckii]SFK84499.1 N-acetylmuramoyl-L-alanine amidase [Azotobacter beijerinckii]